MAAALPILDAVRAAGWYVSTIEWESKSTRTVGFIAKSVTGRPVHIVCGES
jgi:hypothetical protein